MYVLSQFMHAYIVYVKHLCQTFITKCNFLRVAAMLIRHANKQPASVRVYVQWEWTACSMVVIIQLVYGFQNLIYAPDQGNVAVFLWSVGENQELMDDYPWLDNIDSNQSFTTKITNLRCNCKQRMRNIKKIVFSHATCYRQLIQTAGHDSGIWTILKLH